MKQPVFERGLYVRRENQLDLMYYYFNEMKSGKEALTSMGEANVDWDADIQLIIDSVGE